MFEFYVIVNGNMVGFDVESIAEIYYNQVSLESETTVQFVRVIAQKYGDGV